MDYFSHIIESKRTPQDSNTITRFDKHVFINAHLIVGNIHVGNTFLQYAGLPMITIPQKNLTMHMSKGVVFKNDVNVKKIILNHRDLHAEITALGIGTVDASPPDKQGGTIDIRGHLYLRAHTYAGTTSYYDLGSVIDSIAENTAKPSTACTHNDDDNESAYCDLESSRHVFATHKDFIMIPENVKLHVGTYDVRHVMHRLNSNNMLSVDTSLLREKHVDHAIHEICTRDIMLNGKSMHHYFDMVASNLTHATVLSNVPCTDVQHFDGDILVQCDQHVLSVRTLLHIELCDVICDLTKTIVVHAPMCVNGHDVIQSVMHLSELVPGAHDLELSIDPKTGHLRTSKSNVIILENALSTGDIVTPDGLNIRMWLEDTLKNQRVCVHGSTPDSEEHVEHVPHKSFPGSYCTHTHKAFTRFSSRLVLCDTRRHLKKHSKSVVPCCYDLTAAINTSSSCVVNGSLFITGRLVVSNFDVLSSIVAANPTYVVDLPMKKGDVRINSDLYLDSMILLVEDTKIDVETILRLLSPRAWYGTAGSFDVAYCGSFQIIEDVFLRVAITCTGPHGNTSETFVSLRSLLGESKTHTEVTWSKNALQSSPSKDDKKQKIYIMGRCIIHGTNVNDILTRSGTTSMHIALIDDGHTLEDVEYDDIVYSMNGTTKSLSQHLGLKSTNHIKKNQTLYTTRAVYVRDHQSARSEKRFFDLTNLCMS